MIIARVWQKKQIFFQIAEYLNPYWLISLYHPFYYLFVYFLSHSFIVLHIIEPTYLNIDLFVIYSYIVFWFILIRTHKRKRKNLQLLTYSDLKSIKTRQIRNMENFSIFWRLMNTYLFLFFIIIIFFCNFYEKLLDNSWYSSNFEFFLAHSTQEFRIHF